MPADCNLTANAKVQWAWTNLADSATSAIGLSTTVNASVIIFDVAEEYKTGMGGGVTTDGGDPIYIIVGGSTKANTKAWGLLAWTFWV